MKNTVLKFKAEKIGETEVRDYFSKNTNLTKIKEDFPELAKYFKKGGFRDNDTPERLTNMLYSNPDLWDFILLTNDRNPLFDLPYDYDTLKTAAEDKLDLFIKQHPRVSISEERKKELLIDFMKDLDIRNEKNRILEAVEPKNLSYVITTLRQAGVL